jgi:phosphoenolpyruvate synthase/pyruvate phosphate dikinase
MKLTLNFTELGRNDAMIAGGKGASLGEMTQAGIPVPPGFVVLSTTFDEFIKEADLVQEIDAIIDGVNHKDINSVEVASEKIQALIKNAEMPERIASEIKAKFKVLDTEFVAVRSSATAEDGADNAWAGQLDSFLNTKEANLLEKVQHCWASLFTPRAIFYRFEKGLHTTKISVAVVVQKMVNSEVSGIAFSVHPVTEDRNQMIIEAGFGLGEAIVSGSVTPDSYVVEKEPRRIIDINVSSQTRALYRVETGGNEWLDIPEPKASSQVLTEAQISEFADLIMRIENHYGFPCDIEWAFEKGKFYIVQSRPITTLLNKVTKETSRLLKGYPEYKWQVAANDFNSPCIRNDIWTRSFEKQSKIFKIPQAFLGISSRNNKIEYFADFDSWTTTNKVLRDYISKDMYYVEKIIDKTNDLGEAFNKWSYENIYNKDLTKLTDKQIISLLEDFSDKQAEMYAYGTILPLIDFLNFSFVESNLKKFLIEKKGERNMAEYFETFTEPISNSFAMDQEEDLLTLMNSFFTQEWSDFVKKSSLEEIKNLFPKFYEKLQKHTEKYCWVYYVYMGPAFKEEDFLDFIKDYLNKEIVPLDKLRELAKKKEELKSLKSEYIKELNPDEFNLMILNLAGKMIWAKPRRKDYQSRSYYHLEKLLEEVGKRLDVNLDQIRSATIRMIVEGLQSGSIDKNILVKMKEHHIILPKDHDSIILFDQEAVDYYDHNIKSEESKTDIYKTEIIGTTACRGKAKGLVKIINEPSEMNKMNQGDILVSTATTPSIVPVMKKASAIVTDEGGLTCHAAIVSREMGTPCVIGTKNATKVLKDGDMVEVDADKGIVRILK